MDNGVKLYREGDQAAALAEFDAAYRVQPKASPLINKALCYKKLKRYADAIESLERAINRHADTLAPAHRTAAEKEMAELRALIAWVVVKTSPKEARIWVDNNEGEYEPARDADGSAPLAPGPNRLRAEAPGFASMVQTVTLVAGRNNPPVSFELTAKEGDLEVVAASEGSWIEIDGRDRSRGRVQIKLEPGVHAVRVKDGSRASALQIVVVAGKRAIVLQQPDGSLVSDAKAPTDPPTATPKKPPPTYRGFYLLASAAILTMATHPRDFTRSSAPQAGYAFGGVAGYRVARWAAFEGFAQYNDVRIHGEFAGDTKENQQFILRGGRIGGALRVMVPGDFWVRFVPVLAGGAAIEEVRFNKTVPYGTGEDTYFSKFGVGVFGQLDLLLEIELSKVVIDLGAQASAHSSKHFTNDPDGHNAFDEKPLLYFGPKLQVGYAFW
jgi:hypothetical protein